MTSKIFRIILVGFTIFLVGLTGCNENSNNKLPLYGSPTKLLPNESLVDAICNIQEEFKTLPNPLMQRMSYKADWTSYKIGAAATHHKGFYRVHLRPEALKFLRQHSRLELVASLVPLFIDPNIGGEAAVLLAGIPAGSDSTQGLITRTIAGSIKQSGYKSPAQQGDWYDNVYQKYYIASSLYGLTNATSRIHKKQIPEYVGSLEEAIVDVLSAFSHSPLVFLKEGHLRMPQPHTEDSVKNWISSHSVPTPKSKSQTFIDKYKGDFSTIVMLPMMPFPQSKLQPYEHYMMWLLGLEKKYWPAMLHLTSGQKIPNTLTKEFRKAYVGSVYKKCQPKTKQKF